MTILIASALLAASPSVAPTTFRPEIPVDEILSGFAMCRSVVTATGLDQSPLKKAHWQRLKIKPSPGETSTELNGVSGWSPPNSFMMLLLTTKAGQVRCNVAAPVADQSAVTEVMSRLPVRLTPGAKRGEFDGDANGQHIKMTVAGDYPTINIMISEPAEEGK